MSEHIIYNVIQEDQEVICQLCDGTHGNNSLCQAGGEDYEI